MPPALDAVEAGVLAGLQVGVRAADMRIASGPGVVRLAVVGVPDPGEVLLETGEEVAGHVIRCGPFVGGQAVAAAEVRAGRPAGQGDQDPGRPRLVDRRFPAALHDAVGVHVPGPVLRVPHPPGELHLDLRVRPERLLADGRELAGRQPESAQVHLAQLGERQGQHDMVGGHIMGAGATGERARVPAVAAAAHGLQAFSEVDDPGGQPADDPRDELVIAAADMPLLVGARQLRAVSWLTAAGRAVVVTEKVDQVERGLPGHRAAVLVEEDSHAQPAEVAAEAARDVLLDPLRGGRVVPSPPPGGVLVIPGGPGRLAEGGVVEQPEPPRVPVPVEGRLRPEPPAEPEPVIGGPGVRRIDVDVVQVQAQPGGQPAHRGVLTRDELAVLLGVLPAVEESAEGVHPAARPGGVVLVDLAGQAMRCPQPQGAAQPREPRADDHYPGIAAGRGGPRPSGTGGNGRGQGRGGGAAQNAAPGDPAGGRQRPGGLVDVTSGLAGVGGGRLRLPERSRRR